MIPIHITPDEVGIAILAIASLIAVLLTVVYLYGDQHPIDEVRTDG